MKRCKMPCSPIAWKPWYWPHLVSLCQVLSVGKVFKFTQRRRYTVHASVNQSRFSSPVSGFLFWNPDSSPGIRWFFTGFRLSFWHQVFLRYPGFYYGIRILLLVSGGSSSGIRILLPVFGFFFRFLWSSSSIRVLILASGFSSWYPGVLLPVSGGPSSGFRFPGSHSSIPILLLVSGGSSFGLRASHSGIRVYLPIFGFLFRYPDSSSGFWGPLPVFGFFFRYPSSSYGFGFFFRYPRYSSGIRVLLPISGFLFWLPDFSFSIQFYYYSIRILLPISDCLDGKQNMHNRFEILSS